MENMTPEKAIEAIESRIAEKTAGFAKSEEITSLKNDLAAVKELVENTDAANEMKKSIADVEAQLLALKEQPKEEPARTVREAIANAVKGAKEELASLAEKTKGNVSLAVKVAGEMTITGNYSGGTVGLSTLEGGLTRVQRRRPFLRQLVNAQGTSSKYVVWIEQANPDPGEAGMTAEAALKTQTDFDLVERSAEVKKITAWIKVSKEMLADIPFMQGEINGELMELIELKLDQQILLGDGTGNNLTGIDANAVAWAAGTFTGTIDQANNSDVLRVGIAQMENANFMPTTIMVNPADAAAMELTKDSNGQYTYPVFIDEAGMRVKGLPVVTNPLIPADTFYICDMTKDHLRIREEMNIQVGYVDDDFTRNMVTVLAEMRAANFVKVNHYNAFIKGTFSAAKGALETP